MAYQYAIADRQGWQVDSPTLRIGTTVNLNGCAYVSGAGRTPYAFFSQIFSLLIGPWPDGLRIRPRAAYRYFNLDRRNNEGRCAQARKSHKTKVRER